MRWFGLPVDQRTAARTESRRASATPHPSAALKEMLDGPFLCAALFQELTSIKWKCQKIQYWKKAEFSRNTLQNFATKWRIFFLDVQIYLNCFVIYFSLYSLKYILRIQPLHLILANTRKHPVKIQRLRHVLLDHSIIFAQIIIYLHQSVTSITA